MVKIVQGVSFDALPKSAVPTDSRERSTSRNFFQNKVLRTIFGARVRKM
jgi:hypothetical protein